MGEIDRLVAQMDELDRRLRVMEGGQRSGLSSIRNAWMTAGATQTVFGAYDNGPAGATWEDDEGSVGTGFPTITMATGRRVLIQWSARPIGVANSASYRSLSCAASVLINGVGVTPANPTVTRQMANGNTNPFDIPLSCSVIRTVPVGVNTFQITALFGDDVPAAPNLPTLTDVQLMITPLGWG